LNGILKILHYDIIKQENKIKGYAMTAPKNVAKEIIDTLPEDSSFEEIIKALAFDKMIQKGLKDAKNKRTITHKELSTQIAQW